MTAHQQWWSTVIVPRPFDPLDDLVVLRIHGDFIDTSQVGNVFTVTQAGGFPKIDTVAPIYGAASMGFNNLGTVTAPGNPALDLGGGSYTVNAWIKTTYNGNQGIFNVSTVGAGFGIRLSLGNIQWSQDGGGTGSYQITFPYDDGVWHHLEFSYDSTTNIQRVYVDGAIQAIHGPTVLTIAYDGTPINIGSSFLGEKFRGNIEDILVTKAVRHLGPSFTPPTAPYPDF